MEPIYQDAVIYLRFCSSVGVRLERKPKTGTDAKNILKQKSRKKYSADE